MSVRSFSPRQRTPCLSYAEVAHPDFSNSDGDNDSNGDPLEAPHSLPDTPDTSSTNENGSPTTSPLNSTSAPSPPTVQASPGVTPSSPSVVETDTEPIRRSDFAQTVEEVLEDLPELSHPPMPRFNAPSKAELETEMSNWALREGFALKVRSNNKPRRRAGRPQRHYITYQCIRGGEYRDSVGEEARQRAASTFLTSCPFAVKVHLVPHDGRPRYLVVGHPEKVDSDGNRVRTDLHNHPPIHPGQDHRMRQLRSEILEQIRSLAKTTLSPVQIYAHICDLYPLETANLLSSDISRYCKQARASQLCGAGPAEYLRRYLAENAQREGIIYRIEQRGDDDTLNTAVWLASTSRALAHRFSTVLSVDVTYNGDRHDHKILHIAGFTATNESFTIALAAMPDENEETITRCLQTVLHLLGGNLVPEVVVTDRGMSIRNAVAAVWPSPATQNLFCSWHIEENLRTWLAQALSMYVSVQQKAQETRRAAEAAARRSRRSRPSNGPGGGFSGGATQTTTQPVATISDAPPESAYVLFDDEGRVLDSAGLLNLKKRVVRSYRQKVIQAKTEEELRNGLAAWAAEWRGESYHGALERVVVAGLRYAEDDGDGFIHCRTNRYLHFNQRTTSRLEAMHASLRSYIGDRSRRHRLPVDRLVVLSLDKFRAQWSQLRHHMDYEISHRPSSNSLLLFHQVKARVSEHALNLLKNQLGIAKNIIKRRRGVRYHRDGRLVPETPPCTHQFRTSVGLPCAHEIARVQDTVNNGSGALTMAHFHRQWWLTDSSTLLNLKDTLDARIQPGSPVVTLEIDVLQPCGPRRLLDPLTASARRSLAVGGSATSRRAPPRRGPRTHTGRLLTQAEVRNGDEPHVSDHPRCPACLRHHDPFSNPCRESTEAATATATAAERRESQRDGEETQFDSDDDDFRSINPVYLSLRAADCDSCPFCRKNHSRRWCNLMYEWRRWYAAQNAAGDRQEPASPNESFVSALEVASEPSESLEDAERVAEAVIACGESVPATPERLPFDPYYDPTPSPPTVSAADLELDDIVGWSNAVRTQRLGSIHHEWMAEQPYPSSNDSMVPETQLETSSPVPAPEPVTTPSDSEMVSPPPLRLVPEGVERSKRRRCSP